MANKITSKRTKEDAKAGLYRTCVLVNDEVYFLLQAELKKRRLNFGRWLRRCIAEQLKEWNVNEH